MTVNRTIFQRRSPKQARSRATWEAIVEAAAQIVERGGAEALNTNEVAERAGVSIGTLYQYFPDKQAILLAAARRELGQGALPGRQKALVEALISFVERLGANASLSLAKAEESEPPPAKPRKRRRGPSWESRLSDLVQGVLDDLLAPAQPPLKPIRVKARRLY